MAEREAPAVATYLRGKRIGFRAPRLEDATSANAWMIPSQNPWAMTFGFPMSKAAAEARLKEEETVPWGNNDTIRLVAVELATGAIVGGALVSREHGRTGWIRSQVASWIGSDEAEALEAEMAGLLIEWTRQELDLMVIEYVVAGNRPELIESITTRGFTEAARLREALQGARGRIDLVWLESVNDAWGSRIERSGVADDHA